MSAPAPSPVRGRVRLLRTAALGSASLTLATTAHLLGGGHLPGPLPLIALALLVGTIAVAVTARRCQLPLLAAMLGAEQYGLHAAFGALAETGPSSCLDSGATGHVAAGHVGLTCAGGVGPDGTPASIPMLLAHAVAVLVTAWLLARGEAWAWRVAGEMARVLAIRGQPGLPDAPHPVPPRFLGRMAPRIRLADAAPRGPPRLRTAWMS